MAHHVLIFDPPMCCSSGLCGPSPDPVLIELDHTLTELQNQNIDIERYIITQSPDKFKEHPEVIKLIQEQQLKVLPIVMVNEKIVKTGSYPLSAEWQEWLGVSIPASKKKYQ